MKQADLRQQGSRPGGLERPRPATLSRAVLICLPPSRCQAQGCTVLGRSLRSHRYKKAVLFVDNAGADVILGALAGGGSAGIPTRCSLLY